MVVCQVDVIFERDEEALDEALDQVLDDYGDPIILEHGPVDGLEVLSVPNYHDLYSVCGLVSFIVGCAHSNMIHEAEPHQCVCLFASASWSDAEHEVCIAADQQADENSCLHTCAVSHNISLSHHSEVVA